MRRFTGRACLCIAWLPFGCSVGSVSPAPPAQPVPPLMGPWSVAPTRFPWCEVVFAANRPPCDGVVHAIFPDHMQFQAEVSWSFDGSELKAVRKGGSSEPLALLHVEHGQLQGELHVSHPFISNDGHGADAKAEVLSFQAGPRRAGIPLPPGATLQDYQSDQTTAVGGRMLHCEIFHYTAPGNPEKFFRAQLHSRSGPLATVSDGLEVVVKPKPTGFDVWMERPTP